MTVEIRHKADDVILFLENVRAGADAAKDELGFLPRGAYQSIADSGKLIVAIKKIDGNESYAGHLMFGGIYPNAKIFQLFVDARFRKQGIAARLVYHLKERLIAKQWLSITANVATDLPANAFWSRMGFRTSRTRAGGHARQRWINVRVLDLETPSLLSLMPGAPNRQSLRLAERLSPRPIYLIDLNVFFDAVRRRKRSQSADKIISAGLRNSIRLMVADEFIAELQRTSDDRSNDPILAFATKLDYLRKPPAHKISAVTDDLASIIFPSQTATGSLSEQDKSDLVHIATAIYHKATGFITSEKAILRASNILHEKYDIYITSAEEFGEIVDVSISGPSASVTNVSGDYFITRRNHEDDITSASAFLRTISDEPAFLHEALACQGSRAEWLLVIDDDGPHGYAKWEVHGGPQRTADVYLAVDEDHSATATILDHLLETISREVSIVGPTLLHLHIPSGQVATRQAALLSGFHPPQDDLRSVSILQRLATGRVVSERNWNSIRQSLVLVANLTLPSSAPIFAADEPVMILKTGNKTIELTLNEAEQVLSPVLFLIPGRDGVIVPIREQYARELLGSGSQPSMLPAPEATLRSMRVYISGRDAYQRMVPGQLILFYESIRGGGQGAVIAIARICGCRNIEKTEAIGTVRRHGVLDDRTLDQRSTGSRITETSFDNLFLFTRPVKLDRLRKLGCDNGSRFVTATAVPFDKLVKIVDEGKIGVEK